jgi:hypothetical protein
MFKKYQYFDNFRKALLTSSILASLPTFKTSCGSILSSEYDFSKAEQGKFYDTDATFHYPIYLETDVDQFLQKIAENKNIDLQILVNELLRNNIKIIQSVQ